MLWCSDVEEKDALIAAEPGIFYTTPHYDGHPTVLVPLARDQRAGAPRVPRRILAGARSPEGTRQVRCVGRGEGHDGTARQRSVSMRTTLFVLPGSGRAPWVGRSTTKPTTRSACCRPMALASSWSSYPSRNRRPRRIRSISISSASPSNTSARSSTDSSNSAPACRHRARSGGDHVVLADPEGNEFCVVLRGEFLADTGLIGAVVFEPAQSGHRSLLGQGDRVAGRLRPGWRCCHPAPDGRGPFITFGPPGIAKRGKNRLHLDLAPTPTATEQQRSPGSSHSAPAGRHRPRRRSLGGAGRPRRERVLCPQRASGAPHDR